MKRLIAAAMCVAAFALPAHAEGYFKGKTITYIIATNPGGNYDAYARAIGRHLEKSWMPNASSTKTFRAQVISLAPTRYLRPSLTG